MSEERCADRQSVWSQALKLLRGGDTAALVERFTQEVTLVAEGLCEDQARLRQAVDGLSSRAQEEQERMEEAVKSLDARLTEVSCRIAALEQKRRRRLLPDAAGLSRVVQLLAVLCGTALIFGVLRLLR